MLFKPGINTIEEVLIIRAKAVSFLTDGLVTTDMSNENISFRQQFAMPIKDVIEECDKFLQTVDPDTYGARVKCVYPFVV
jgi:hypothetical protein